MGSVYRAESLSTGAVVALKVLKLDTTRDPRALRRFQREAESGTRIESPYVARTLESGSLGEGGLAFIAMEFAEGQSFEELVQSRERLEPARALPLLEQLFAALSAAHAVGIVHRDLKPDNVRCAAEGSEPRLKVLDFGIAKAVGISTLSATTPGLGTPLWTAPEQAREGYQPAPTADVWSLGLLTFFALTGVQYWRHAAARASMADLAIELIKSELEPPSQRVEQLGVPVPLPVGFDAWFERCVNRDPAARFRDAAEAWQALTPILKDELSERGKRGGAPATARQATVERSAAVLPRPALFLTLVILSCVAMGAVIYWLLRSARI
jgi:serine/threonine protein kinase